MARQLCALLFLCLAVRASADPEVFELRTRAGFQGRTVNKLETVTGESNSSSFHPLGTFSFSQIQNGEHWDGYAGLSDVSLEMDGRQLWLFSLADGNSVANGWTAALDAGAMENIRSGDHVIWLDFKPGQAEGGALPFLVPSEYSGHALGLMLAEFPVRDLRLRVATKSELPRCGGHVAIEDFEH